MGMSQREVEVSADAQRMDFYFAPDQTPGPDAAARGPRAAPAIFARMAVTSCVVEHYRQPPDTDAVRGCLRKQLTWHHTRIKEAGKEAGRAPLTEGEPRSLSEDGLRPPGDGGPEIAVLWALSSGRPADVMTGFALQPLDGWPSGVYAGPLPAVPFRVVVINELPEDLTTLPLRLLGRGATLRRALRELVALPLDTWERQHILPLLVEFRFVGQEVDTSAVLTEEEKEMIVNAQEFVRNLEEQAATALERGIQQGVQQGLQQGVQQGLQQGVQQGLQQGMQQGLQQSLLHQFTRKLGRPLSEEERAILYARLDTLGPDRLGDVVLDLAPTPLAAWLADPAAS